MPIYANVYDRTGDDFTLRTRLECESAEGVEVVNGIGYGKITVPHYANFRLSIFERVQIGNVIFVWTNEPNGKIASELDTVTDIHYISCFIVKSRSYKDSKYEISGPSFIGELQDYVALVPVGELTEITATAESLGTRTIWQTDPDTYEAWEAGYRVRTATTEDVTPYVEGKTKYGLLFTSPVAMQVTDTLTYTYASGTVFTTTATAINDRYNYVELADPIPASIPADATIYINSTRLRVDDATDFVVGSPIYYTYTEPGLNLSGITLMVEQIEIGDVSAPDYLYFTTPISFDIDTGATITQKQYTSPTTDDVAMLLEDSTFSEWNVLRGEDTDIGTSYAPNAESVWDVLLAICDISGYHVRWFLYPIVTAAGTIAAPARRIEYFVPGEPAALAPPRADQVTELGMDMRLSRTYGTMLGLEYEDSHDEITHLIPYGSGGGSGRFDFRDADIGPIMEDYPLFRTGSIGTGISQYFVYNTAGNDRAVWAVETFSHISPLESTTESRREAAGMLLRAACEWLTARTEPDATYRAEIFTNGEPRPGDLIDSLEWEGADPTSTTAEDLIITEVRHVVTPDRPYRVTTLTMNTAGTVRMDGDRMAARSILDMQRVIKHSNFASEARVKYDGVEFGGDGGIRAGTGDISIWAVAGDVNIDAPFGDVTVDAQNLIIDAPVSVEGDLHIDGSLVLSDDARGVDWAVSVLEVRGVPRLRLTRRNRN